VRPVRALNYETCLQSATDGIERRFNINMGYGFVL
jgi:hypothetical protein